MKTAKRGTEFAAPGIQVPRVLLPRKGIELEKWAVIACDQYTADPDYWGNIDRLVGESPSALRLILPELYLDEPDVGARIRAIHASMHDYLERGVMEEQEAGFVLVRRRTRAGAVRTGILAAIDLDQYDYRAGATSLIRATEGTIPERIPPRTMVRREAPLELPHVLVLYDDPSNTVVDRLGSRLEQFRMLYDFDLMAEGGRLTGYHVTDAGSLRALADAFKSLADPQEFYNRHKREEVLLLAVGDGNHSLAAAKTVWEETKSSGAASNRHPGRYALVELVNIHDPGLEFEPIHRVLFGGAERFLDRLRATRGVEVVPTGGYEAMMAKVAGGKNEEPVQQVGAATESGFSLVRFESPSTTLAAATLQGIIDDFLDRERSVKVDYIHGEESTLRLGQQPGNIGFFLPPIYKSGFFETIVRDGSFPRKTFSMGEADEKRFYLEARRIVQA